MYNSKKDIDKIDSLMKHIQDGKVSRNKHFFQLLKLGEYRRFRRAKLFLSLLDDLRVTSSVRGNTIEIIEESENVQINLFNPSLRYHRKITLSSAELRLLRSNPGFKIANYSGSSSSA